MCAEAQADVLFTVFAMRSSGCGRLLHSSRKRYTVYGTWAFRGNLKWPNPPLLLPPLSHCKIIYKNAIWICAALLWHFASLRMDTIITKQQNIVKILSFMTSIPYFYTLVPGHNVNCWLALLTIHIVHQWCMLFLRTFQSCSICWWHNSILLWNP